MQGITAHRASRPLSEPLKENSLNCNPSRSCRGTALEPKVSNHIIIIRFLQWSVYGLISGHGHESALISYHLSESGPHARLPATARLYFFLPHFCTIKWGRCPTGRWGPSPISARLPPCPWRGPQFAFRCTIRYRLLWGPRYGSWVYGGLPVRLFD